MALLLNMLIEWPLLTCSQVKPHIERILWLDSSLSNVIVIRLFDKRALPIKRSYREIVDAIAANEARTLQTEPYLGLLRPEKEFKESHRRRRDSAWELIEELVVNVNPQFMLNPAVRGPIITSLSVSSGRTKRVIYNYLRRYWQAGGIRNALLPDFNKCGGRGKRRLSEDSNAPKLGRKSSLAKDRGCSTGIRITPDIERLFERGAKRFYESPDQLKLSDAFDLTLKTYFHKGFALENGVPIPVLPPAEELPSLRQFRYWYETVYRDPKREQISREGEREYNLKGRELLGDSTQMAFGPGSLYQIDATIGNVYLVNSLDRTRIIGRPVIYICSDVFSRMITGFSVTLEGPSWLGAMLALDNVATDKVAFCAEYEISIRPEEWTCQNLPEAILADRGEFAGFNPSNLVNALRTRVHNTAPWRPDMKGIVERDLGRLEETVIRFLPGYVPHTAKRGDPDYALEAALTLDELRKLLIVYVLDHNMNRYMKSYRKDEFMIADHVERYPLDIWEWGIENRSGHLQPLPRDIIRLNLLPRRLVTVTPSGIHFEGELYYTCDLAMSEGWFGRARVKGSWDIEVAYDIRSTNHIYLPLDRGSRLEVCHLTPASQHLRGRDLQEVSDYFAQEKLSGQGARTRTQQSKARVHTLREQIVSNAKDKTKAAIVAVGELSKAARKRGINSNRAEEKQLERDKGAWTLGGDDQTISSVQSGILVQGAFQQSQADDGYVPPARKANRIRKHRNKEWRKDEKC
jgi:hypothetical protein